MTIVPSEFPSPDDVGSLSWRISVRKPDGTFVPLAGRSDTRDDALRDMVVKAQAYMQQNPGPYSDMVALHINKNYVQVQGGVVGEALSVEDVVARIVAAYDEEAAAEAERERRQREINAIPVLSPTPPSSVRAEWERVTRWLSANTTTPAEYQVPAVAPEESAAATDGWPDELVEFLGLHAGAPRRLVPLNSLLTPTEIRSARSMMLGVWAKLAADDPEMTEGSQSSLQAGTPAYRFLPEYIPFAGLDGYFLFIDTRPGPMHGCITEYGRDTADDGGPKWHSLSSMLSDLADSVETGAVFDRMWLPHIIDNQLDWQTRP